MQSIHHKFGRPGPQQHGVHLSRPCRQDLSAAESMVTRATVLPMLPVAIRLCPQRQMPACTFSCHSRNCLSARLISALSPSSPVRKPSRGRGTRLQSTGGHVHRVAHGLALLATSRSRPFEGPSYSLWPATAQNFQVFPDGFLRAPCAGFPCRAPRPRVPARHSRSSDRPLDGGSLPSSNRAGTLGSVRCPIA